MGAGTPSSPRSHTRCSASSIVRCASTSVAGTSSAAKRVESKRPVALLEQSLHPPLGVRESFRRAAHARHTFLEQLEGAVEREIVALELGDDGVEAGEAGFE